MENSNNLNGGRRIRKSTTANSKSRPEMIKDLSEFLKQEVDHNASSMQPASTGRTHMTFTSEKTITTEDVMEQYDIFAERTIKINSLILETGSKELENEFGELIQEFIYFMTAVNNKNRQEWLNHGFEPVV